MGSPSGNIELLQSIEDVSGVWVQAALRRAGINVPEISDLRHAPIGNGNSNDTYKLSFEYAAASKDAPKSLTFKIHSSNPEVAQRAGQAGAYNCEHEMCSLLGSVPHVQTPRFYHTAISEDGCSSNILMDDLSQVCEAGNQITGVSEAQAQAAVEQLLNFHLHFWCSDELASIDWTMDRFQVHHEGKELLKERLAAVLSANELRILDQSAPLIDDWLATTPAFPTLTHGDCRADNILFKTDQSGSVSAYLIDWATCAIGDAMADIAYLLVSSVPTEQRAQCEEKALRVCAETIRQVEPSYSLDKARDAYRANITSSMYMTMRAGFAAPSPHVEKLLETLMHRNCAALKDWLFS